MKIKDPKFIAIDLFCGAGGTTTGYSKTDGLIKTIACVNHDAVAIQSHWENHKDVVHFEEDIRTLNLSGLIEVVRKARLKYPNAKLILWASLECTNFCNAKGGVPKIEDSRTLANDLFRYIDALRPDVIKIENVREFMRWGDLGPNGLQIKSTDGIRFNEWMSNVISRGYAYSHQYMNSADYGSLTRRIRYFGAFYLPNVKMSFPKPTHREKSTERHLYAPWKAVGPALDLDDLGASIFNRKRAIVNKSFKRVYDGIMRHVDEDSLLITYYNNSGSSPLSKPCPTIRTKDTFMKVHFLANDYSGGGQYSPLDKPAPTLTTIPKSNLATACVISHQFTDKGVSIRKPCPTIIARQDKKPLYLLTAEKGEFKIPVYSSDVIYKFDKKGNISEEPNYETLLKRFMAKHNIVDVYMRMLNVRELKTIQGFPEDYILKGTQADQKKFIGNSVVPLLAERWGRALAEVN